MKLSQSKVCRIFAAMFQSWHLCTNLDETAPNQNSSAPN